MSTEHLTFIYKNYRGEISRRRVHPSHVWFGSTPHHPEPQWFLQAVDLDKNLPRIFAFKDIVSMAPTIQDRVASWVEACFPPEVVHSKDERNFRFLEEALELVQANGCSWAEANEVITYVYDRPKGDVFQEIGGVMMTLAALCVIDGSDMLEAAEVELTRIQGKIEEIRAKQAGKPKPQK